MIRGMTKAALSMYQQSDRRDAELFLTYRRLSLTRRGWLMLLSGLAGFQRNLEV